MVPSSRIAAVSASGTFVAGGAERDRVVLILGGAADPVALRAVEGQLLAIRGEEVLAKELAETLEQGAKPADHRIVATNRLLGLGDVDDEGVDHPEREQTESRNSAPAITRRGRVGSFWRWA
jgi:hypothetical protein